MTLVTAFVSLGLPSSNRAGQLPLHASTGMRRGGSSAKIEYAFSTILYL